MLFVTRLVGCLRHEMEKIRHQVQRRSSAVTSCIRTRPCSGTKANYDHKCPAMGCGAIAVRIIARRPLISFRCRLLLEAERVRPGRLTASGVEEPGMFVRSGQIGPPGIAPDRLCAGADLPVPKAPMFGLGRQGLDGPRSKMVTAFWPRMPSLSGCWL